MLSKARVNATKVLNVLAVGLVEGAAVWWVCGGVEWTGLVLQTKSGSKVQEYGHITKRNSHT